MLAKIQAHWIKKNFKLPDRTIAKQLGVSHSSFYRLLSYQTGSIPLKLATSLHEYVESTRINSVLDDVSLLLPQLSLNIRAALFTKEQGWLLFGIQSSFWRHEVDQTRLTWSPEVHPIPMPTYCPVVPKPRESQDYIYLRDLLGSHLWEKHHFKSKEAQNLVDPSKIRFQPVIKFKDTHHYENN